MSTKRELIWLISLCTLVLSLAWTAPVQAQDPTPANDENCVSCHENQYYLHDTGKWFCLCEAPMHCVYCHGGRTDSLKEEIAHEGLVLHPTSEHAARCQACHTQDYSDRVEQFAAAAGIRATPAANLTATPVRFAAMPAIELPGMPVARISQLEPWRVAGLSLLGSALLGIIFFGIRCYQQDCAQRS